MADPGFKLDRKGGAEVLREMVADQINELAKHIAAQAGPDAEVETYATDRAAASVRVPADQQAKDGVLTRAAAAAGLDVRLKTKK
jgi:hypothetical protein